MNRDFGLRIHRVYETDERIKFTLVRKDGEGGRLTVAFEYEDDDTVRLVSHGSGGTADPRDRATAIFLAIEYLRRSDDLTVTLGPVSGFPPQYGLEAPFYAIPGGKTHVVKGRDRDALCGTSAGVKGGTRIDSLDDALELPSLCTNCRRALEGMT